MFIHIITSMWFLYFISKMQYPGRDQFMDNLRNGRFLLEGFWVFSLCSFLFDLNWIFKFGIGNYRMLITTFSIGTEEVCLTPWETHLPTSVCLSLCKTERFSSLSGFLPLTSLPQLCVWIFGGKVGGRSQLFWVGYCIWAVGSVVEAKHSVSKNRGFWNVSVTILKLPIENTFLTNYLELKFNGP